LGGRKRKIPPEQRLGGTLRSPAPERRVGEMGRLKGIRKIAEEKMTNNSPKTNVIRKKGILTGGRATGLHNAKENKSNLN